MNRNIVVVLLTGSLFFVSASHALAWGRGGGFHAASFSAGGYRGGYAAGGYRGVDVNGYRGVDVNGYRGVDVNGYRGVDVGGYRAAEVGGARVGEVGGHRAAAVGGHTALGTDFGFGHVVGTEGARTFVATGHYTTAYSGNVLATRGAVVRGGFYHYGAFNTGWWGAHTGAWRPYGWDAARVWGWATWPGLVGWFGWSADPVYYDYGNTIVYQGDQVEINGQPGPTAAEYYQQAADLAQSAPPAPPTENKDEEWQALGVFALVQGDQSDPSAVFQLAVNKAGTIRGNYYNVLTDTTLPVRGAVDKKTQRASWIVGDQKSTVYDTGIFNLTKDESPLLIHYGKERTQEWLLVRVQQKDEKAPAASSVVNIPPAATGGETARITLVVPANAEVLFDGHATTETGTERIYNTPPLERGANYSYSIRARWTADGKPVEQTRTVPVKAGAQVRVDFTSPTP